MSRKLSTVKAVVEALGGKPAVAALTGRSWNAVWNWEDRGSFPTNTHLIMQVALEAQSQCAPAKLWGMPEAVDG